MQTHAETQQVEGFDDKGAAHPLRVPVSALRLLVDVLTEQAQALKIGYET